MLDEDKGPGGDVEPAHVREHSQMPEDRECVDACPVIKNFGSALVQWGGGSDPPPGPCHRPCPA